MSGPELKTCPFCGVRPHVHDDASHSTAFFADCYNDNCTVQPSAYGLSKAEAIAAWNTRAPLTVQDAAKVPEIAALMDARRRYIELVEKYNAKLHSVKAQRLRGDWSQDVTTEFREMIEAHQNFIAAAQTAADAALRAIADSD